MALTTKTPGVYIQEVSTLPASVAQVETAIPAFLGYTTKASAPTTPVRISSMVEYEENFGGPRTAVTVPISGSSPNFSVGTLSVDSTNFLYECMQMYFANGGGPCYVVSTGTASGTITDTDFYDPSDSDNALDKISKEDEPTLIVMPELVNLANTGVADSGGFYDVVKAALTQCNTLQDRFTIIDIYEGTTHTLTDAIDQMRTDIGTQYKVRCNLLSSVEDLTFV